MYGCGSDDENRKNLYFRKNVLPDEEGKVGDANPLIMSSSVAFGSEDWDDFELETRGGIGASFTSDKFQQPEPGSTSVALTVAPVGETEIGKGLIEEHAGIRDSAAGGSGESLNSGTVVPFGAQNSVVDHIEDVRDILVANCQVQGGHELAKDDQGTSIVPVGFPGYCEPQEEDVKDISFNCNQVQGANDTTERYKNCPVSNVFEVDQEPLVEKSPIGLGVDFTYHRMDDLNPSVKPGEVVCPDDNVTLENEEAGNLKTEYSENASAEFIADQKLNSTQSMLENNMKKASENAPGSVIPYEDHPAVVKAENFELIEFYDEIVNEMEEILLDSVESPGARFPQGNRMFHSQLLLPLRDGGSTASTSGTDEAYLLITQPQRIDGVEVVGAKQKKGDVSLSERLVGVKEYTAYIIRVWSGKNQWEVERRYRDFYTLYRRLKSLFADQGWTLPSPWSSVEKESRKIFGNASPDVVSERSVLIQECLHSTIHSGFFTSPPSALVWFLCPRDSFPSSPAARHNRSSMLEAQHYTCAGCHNHFDDGMTLLRDFVQTLGWGKPRLCEYTGQLFCSSCHTNETAVLPARPMLCVSAVNPFLFSKVPALNHIMGVRKKIGTMLSYVRCPFHRTINEGLGSRRYLLEGNDFFALRDLIDLSKGAFAALPVMVETVSRKILEHITEQCLICYDVGVPCSARQACNDPSSLIFPFQEGETERCASCESVFHKPCFRKLTNCSCGAHLRTDEVVESTSSLSREASGLTLGRRSGSTLGLGLLSGLFSKANPEKVKDYKDNDAIILMGSLPSNFL
ncbi:PLECKSTRIN HOMOLOGY DOMAIN CONTAINING PROTEIN [Salix koriyanagi]|uniref:PLECKSTRIN HOMOLOGY DOMAIN CONTAINING PROTEIN n=1 Tax=Salix koriyanagi TaxID=2511006 RepID=A0A9Q0SSL1_9ROSI|nr:PLECKSTRIN HOMOLOGY DOMAIN CONTAINING PROTEIN [Salix koriyanagi]